MEEGVPRRWGDRPLPIARFGPTCPIFPAILTPLIAPEPLFSLFPPISAQSAPLQCDVMLRRGAKS